jgi:hypothetical protein
MDYTHRTDTAMERLKRSPDLLDALLMTFTFSE